MADVIEVGQRRRAVVPTEPDIDGAEYEVLGATALPREWNIKVFTTPPRWTIWRDVDILRDPLVGSVPPSHPQGPASTPPSRKVGDVLQVPDIGIFHKAGWVPWFQDPTFLCGPRGSQSVIPLKWIQQGRVTVRSVSLDRFDISDGGLMSWEINEQDWQDLERLASAPVAGLVGLTSPKVETIYKCPPTPAKCRCSIQQLAWGRGHDAGCSEART